MLAFPMRHYFYLLAALAYLLTANLIWIARDNRPPFWDMAHHQSVALRILDETAANGLSVITTAPSITAAYPPFYHSIVALFYSIFGRSMDAAQWANIPALVTILFATFGIAKRVLPRATSVFAAALATFYPYLLWISRETVIDYWLTAMVAAALWFLVRTDEFSLRGRAIAFGVVAGLGMLTKPTFALFLALPSLWAARKNWKNALLSAGTAGAIASYWYLPQLQGMLQYWNLVSSYGDFEGDPPLLSMQGLLFYVRALEGYQIFLPLFALFIVGIFCLVRRPKQAWLYVVLWIASGWLGLLMIQNKDPRFSAPLLPAVAIVSAAAFEKRERWIIAILPLLAFQHYLVSFGIRRLPETIVIAKGLEGAQLTWNWNLYTQSYFGLWGRPVKENWHIEDVLDRISPDRVAAVRLGLVPDIPRFDWQAFQFTILLRRFNVTMERISGLNTSEIVKNDYILVSENGQGYAEYVSDEWKRINDHIFADPQTFHLLEIFQLPTGEAIRLYEVVRP